MNLYQLEVFKKAAELESVSGAARELRVAQPAVSKTIRALESELEVKLFDRVGKHIELNGSGKLMLGYVNAALQSLDEAKAALKAGRQPPELVTITMTCASKLLPALVSGFRARHPEVPLSASYTSEGSPEARRSDITIFQTNSKVSGEAMRLLIEEEVFLAVPARHPLAGRASLELMEAANEDFIALSTKKQFRVSTDEYCRQAGFSPKVVLESDDPATIRALIQHGFGFAFMPEYTWGRLDDPAIARVRIHSPRCRRYIYVSWKKRHTEPDAVMMFVEYLEGYFRELKAGGIQI